MVTASLHRLRIPFKRPFGHSIITRDHAEAIILVLEANGRVGVGECVPRVYVTGETFESVWSAILGLDLSELWSRVDMRSKAILARSVEQLELPRLLRSDVLGLSAGCAAELAVLDLACKLNGWQLRELAFEMGLPAAILSETPLDETISVPLDLQKEPHELASLVGSRLGHLKVKVGADLEMDVLRLRQCRQIFGPLISMSVDANMAWSFDDAIMAADLFRPFRIAWYEEPLQKSSRHQYKAFRERSSSAVMLDESACSLEQTKRAIQSGHCDFINIRLSKCGGYLPSLRLAELAARSGIKFQHGTQVGQLGFLNAAGRHFTSTVRDIVACEGGPGLANLEDFPTTTQLELDLECGAPRWAFRSGYRCRTRATKTEKIYCRVGNLGWRKLVLIMSKRNYNVDSLPAPAANSNHLSSEQRRFYFLHQMDPCDPEIYICQVLRITGRLNRAIFQASILDIARRHDTLRSFFPIVDGQPFPSVHPGVGSAMRMIDLSSVPADGRDVRAREVIDSETRIHEPFCLETGPLFRGTIIRVDETAYIVVLRFHHIVMDGTSVRLFLSDLFETYTRLSRGEDTEGQEYKFRDFVTWEQTRLTDRVRRENMGYWSEKLAKPPVVDLAVTRPRPLRHTKEAGTVRLLASSKLRARLQAFCQTQRVTPYMVAMSVLHVLLVKVTGGHDILIGTPIACRQRRELQPMLGVLLSWIAFRASIGPATTFMDLLMWLTDDFPSAYAKQSSYELLMAAAGELGRDPSRNALISGYLELRALRCASQSGRSSSGLGARRQRSDSLRPFRKSRRGCRQMGARAYLLQRRNGS